MGFTNFYCQFISNFSHHTRVLFDLTKKDVRFMWGNHEQDTFDRLKELVTLASVLALLDSECLYRVEADGSGVTMGAILSQLSPEGDKWHPVAFLSKSLSAVECNYEIHDTEMLMIV